MSIPRFKIVQGVTAWNAGSVTECSTTGGTGALLSAIVASINYSSNVGPTGPQASNAWSSTHPVTIGNNSYEFVWGLSVAASADNSLSNFKVWVDSTPNVAGCTFYMGTVLASAFTAPTTGASSIASTNFTSLVGNGSSMAVGAPSNSVGSLSSPIYTQVRTTVYATGGNQSSMPKIDYSIDWS